MRSRAGNKKKEKKKSKKRKEKKDSRRDREANKMSIEYAESKRGPLKRDIENAMRSTFD